jgi:hypothetical protein
MWVPKGTPSHITSRLGSAVVEALSGPAVQKRIADVGQEIVPRAQQTRQALAAHHKAEIEKWMPMVKAAKAKIEWIALATYRHFSLSGSWITWSRPFGALPGYIPQDKVVWGIAGAPPLRVMEDRFCHSTNALASSPRGADHWGS